MIFGVHAEYTNCCSANNSPPDKVYAAPLKVFAPNLEPGIKKSREFSCMRIDSCEV
jgi:hypothetical protein